MRALIWLATVLLAGCVTTSAVRFDSVTQQYPEVERDSVKVYATLEDVPEEFERVAMIDAEGEHRWTSRDGMLNAMKAKAGEVGANAIILGDISEPGAGEQLAGALFYGVSADRRGRVLAIHVYNPVGDCADLVRIPVGSECPDQIRGRHTVCETIYEDRCMKP